MQIEIPQVLDTTTLTAFRELSREENLFADGNTTAGWYASAHKNNEQAGHDRALSALLSKVEQTVMAHPLIQASARPRQVLNVLFSRYREGMYYGQHVDDALMNGQRSDLSFTLFVSAPDEYDGGELVLDQTGGEQWIKADAGSLFLYPSTSLHRVEPVTRGERLALVGWLNSHIRQSEHREILFDLDRSIESWRQSHGAEGDALALLLKTRSNLLRLWAD